MTKRDLRTAGIALNGEQQRTLRALRDFDGAPMRGLLLEVLTQNPDQDLMVVYDSDLPDTHPVQQAMLAAFQMMVKTAMGEALKDPLPMTDTALAERLHASGEMLKENTLGESKNPLQTVQFKTVAGMYDDVCVALFDRVCHASAPVMTPSPVRQ